MTALKAGKVLTTLDKNLNTHGVIYTTKQFIEKMISEGFIVESHPTAGRILINRAVSPNVYTQKQLSKTAFDYAEHLMNLHR